MTNERLGGSSKLLRFVLHFTAAILLFEVLYYTVLGPSGALLTILRVNASWAGWVLSVFGQEVAVEGVWIRSADFAIAVQRGCDGLQPLGILIAGLLALPTRGARRWGGIVAGLLFVIALNVVRLVTLCWVARDWPAEFEWVHLDLWQPLFLSMALLFWLPCALLALPKTHRPS